MTDPCDAKPLPEHEWLMQFVGEWTYEHECGAMGPDQPAQVLRGTQTSRSLGGMWLLSEGRGETPGDGTASMLITLGYDPAKKKYVGSFIGSMMHNLWIYEGSLDSAGKILTLDSEGPSFSGDGTLSKYQDILELISPNHHTLSSQVLGPDGQWQKFMTAHYRRK